MLYKCMKRNAALLLLIYPGLSVGGEYTQALKTSLKAFVEVPTIKTYRKTLEKKIKRSIPVDKKILSTAGSAAAILIRQEIDTTKFKNLRVKALGGQIKPKAKYNFKTGESLGEVYLKWSF